MPYIGDGTPESPRRINLPTYSTVAELMNGALAVVDIPDDDGPDPGDLDPETIVAPGIRARLVSNLTPLQRLRWRLRIRRRYAESAGRYDP